MNPSTYPIYLLTIRGILAPPTLDAARTLHNETAGADSSVAAAQALGDLSHMVYVPVHGDEGEFFIMDVWNNLDGLNQFFANTQVQEQAGRIFTTRDPVVWTPATDFFGYHLPAPTGRNDRFIGIARGTVESREHARAINNQAVKQGINQARKLGDLSHEVYFRLTPEGSSSPLEFLAVDVWANLEGPQQQYQDPAFVQIFSELFNAPPSTWILQHPAGQWVEW